MVSNKYLEIAAGDALKVIDCVFFYVSGGTADTPG